MSPPLSSLLSPHLDEDTVEYICSLLEDDPADDDAREAVEALITDALDDETTAETLIRELWRLLNSSLSGGAGGASNGKGNNPGDAAAAAAAADSVMEETTKRLDKAVTMKENYVVSYASGLRAKEEHGPNDEAKESAIQNFYANMIGIQSEEVMSERARRKAAQKALRVIKADEDRLQAIQDAMAMAEEDPAEMAESSDNNNGGGGGGAEYEAGDSHVDVHFRDFNLPNKKGSGTDLLSNAQLTLSKGRRYGLMGRNGCGKTTLMELIAKRGLNGIPKNMSMLLVRQEIVGNNLTPVEFVLRSDPRVEGLKLYIAKAESTEKSDPVKLAAAYERLVQIEADDGPPEPRARKILSGMGFSEEMQDKPTRELSGGWRMRVSLSCALFANPDLLLLDEPTNHLDLEAVLWLERYLSTKYRGTVLVVSHDRHFLNEIVTDVVHFYRETLNTYRGDISNYEAVVEENKKRQLRLRENQEAKREHLQKYIDLHAQSGENGVKAARQRKSRMKKLDKIGTMAQEGKKYKVSYDGPAEEVEEVVEDEVVELKFPDPGSFDSSILSLDQASFGYSPDRLLLKDVDLTVDVTSRIALLGRNGSGKSTLIKLIVGALQPLKGKATIDGRAKIEYLAQHQLEQLDPEGTPMDTLLERYPGDGGYAHKMELRRYLANFGLGGEVLPLQKINTMSGGQKCRLCLASAMYRKPHLLILDEPTNHLDLETTEALIESIRNFQGGVLLVSHDQHLLTSVCKDLYVVDAGSVEKLNKGTASGLASDAFKAYKKAVIQGKR